MKKELREIDLGANSQSIWEQTGLPQETLVEFVKSVSRRRGTGYRNLIYRVIGTDDAVIIEENHHSSGMFYDRARMEPGYFAQQRAYGAACRRESKCWGLPMEVCLALGPELCEEFAIKVAAVTTVSADMLHELSCGIGRRKAAILKLLDEAPGGLCSERLAERVNSFGQANAWRVADYLSAKADNN